MVETRAIGVREGVVIRRGVREAGGPSAERVPAYVDPVGENGCKGKTKDGKFCSAYPIKETSYCAGHTRSMSGVTS